VVSVYARPLYTWWCQNQSYLVCTPSLNGVTLHGIWTEDRKSHLVLYSSLKDTLLLSWFLIQEFSSQTGKDPELLCSHVTGVVFRCMISILMVANMQFKRGELRESLEANCPFSAQLLSQSKCKWLQVTRKLFGCPFSIDNPPFVLRHPTISASSLPSLVSLWQPLGILGNRLVYSTFHHIGCWIIHLTISRVLKGGVGGWDRE